MTTVDTSDQDHDLDLDHDDDDIQSVSIDEDSDTGDVTATTTRLIRAQDGTTSKITTTEKFSKGSADTVFYKFTSNKSTMPGDQSVEKTVGKATLKKLSDTESDKESDFVKDNLEDILSVLKPFNDMLLHEELADPDMLDELFSMELSDLVKMFYHLLSTSDDMEQAYTKMILGAKAHGVQKFAEEVLQTTSEDNYDNDSQNLSLETITKFIASYKGTYEV